MLTGRTIFGSLRTRMAALIALLIAGSLAIGIASAVAIVRMQEDMGVALRGYGQLRDVSKVGHAAAGALEATRERRFVSARGSIESAEAKLQSSFESAADDELTRRWLASLMAARDALRDPGGSPSAAEAELNQLLGELATASAQIRSDVASHENAIEANRRLALRLVCILGAAVVLGGVLAGIRLYRSVMRPLDELGAGVRRFAGGKLGDRLGAGGDREFALLAADFNQMAGELQNLYNDLEDRVATKSRQLVQSDRLASVGYLAAGAAHEINNPLAIISAYAERSLLLISRDRAAGREVSDETIQSVQRAIEIMCDESFRCKQITDRLLMLARSGEQGRAAISLTQVVHGVATSIAALPRYADRRVIVTSNADASFRIFANEGEIRQVVLNLIINALQAVAPQSGEVRVSLSRVSDQIELVVRDNGRGMGAQTLNRAFEPFFTKKQKSIDESENRVGTGLGLSVAHAIVHDHGGVIEARSDGPGLGSSFVVRLRGSEVAAETMGNDADGR